MPIGTDAFIQNFVAKTCRAIIDDVEKLDVIQDGFIHYQFLRVCQGTRLCQAMCAVVVSKTSCKDRNHRILRITPHQDFFFLQKS